MKDISKDAIQWLKKLSSIDFESNPDLEKDINDFQSLYLRRAINRGKSKWAIIGDKLRFYISNHLMKEPSSKAWKYAIELESMVLFNELTGKKKGEINRLFRESFSSSFAGYSVYSQNILKGKSPLRQLWQVLKPTNISEIREWVEEFKKD